MRMSVWWWGGVVDFHKKNDICLFQNHSGRKITSGNPAGSFEHDDSTNIIWASSPHYPTQEHVHAHMPPKNSPYSTGQ